MSILDNNLRLSFFSGIDVSIVNVPIVEEVELSTSPLDEVLRVIYAPDERTQLPSSDLGRYLSDDTPAEIRDYIKKHLFTDVSGNQIGASLADDDLIMEFTQDNSEYTSEYLQRVQNSLSDVRLRLAAYKAKDPDGYAEIEKRYKTN